MPELPEVETVKRGITPAIKGQQIDGIIIRQSKLRYPVPSHLTGTLPGQRIQAINRRSKYLLLTTTRGHLIVHLGMSGRLHVLSNAGAAQKHDHVDITFKNNICLRYHDPRRFGMILWTDDDPHHHKLLSALGPEPLTENFDGQVLYEAARRRQVCVKQFIMDAHVVVGVGNIYASEALFQAGISPKRPANSISAQRYQALAEHIKVVLEKAIAAGGTTLKDFANSEGNPGYFQQELFVYGRDGLPCFNCQNLIKKITQGQRSTYYCTRCQH